MARDTQKTTKATESFTAEEREAMKERAREAKAASSKADGLNDLLAKIAEMPEPDRAMAERVHAIVMAAAPGPRAPDLVWDARLCEGRQDHLLLPGGLEVQGALLDLRVPAGRDGRRRLDVAVAYALTELTAADEARIAGLVKKAVG